jgi:NADH-quinone oxidoreductase subunit L
VTTFSLAWLVPAVPFVVAVVNLLFGKRLGRNAGWIATIAVALAFVLSVAIVLRFSSLPGDGHAVVKSFGDWITVGSFRISYSVRIDQLSGFMILIVTGIGALIHVYSVGYMDGDPNYGRFFAFMNLFIAFMLVLVLANDFLFLYLGWEGVGLCSYLLIGFYRERPSAGRAAKKAFITTRIGDTAMLIGIALIFVRFGTLDFSTVLHPGSPGAFGISKGAITAITLLLFGGAIGKSAQFPLHVWLPDAMEGPSPVSALIHAATMVTAGVYLVVRTHTLFDFSGTSLTVVLVIGLVTLLYGGIGALGQDDLKRSLAYSTISQLGYMFFAVGMGEYGAAMFMLLAHAMYKALLFLTAGNVMHGLDGELDMKKMGGLRRSMPLTAALFSVGAVALAGIPPLAGFFAKDHIVDYAVQTGRTSLWVLALLGALLSAMYAARMTSLTFFGKPRADLHGHEATGLMNTPLAVLALGALFGGLLDLSARSGWIEQRLGPVTGIAAEGTHGPPEAALLTVSSIVAIGGFGLAWYVWGSGRVDWLALRRRLGGVQPAMAAGLGVDALYASVVRTAGEGGARFLAAVVDHRWIDGAVNGVGSAVRRFARGARVVQNGFVRTYALALLAGAVVLLVYVGLRF